MIKLYCWKTKFPNIGHASMDLAFGEGPGRADYVSWWPGSATGVTSKPGLIWALNVGGVTRYVSTFLGDVEMEGRHPDHAVEIRGLDEDRMLLVWRKIQKDGQYRFLGENCAQTVVAILREGGAELSYSCQLFSARIKVWAPWDVFMYARLINSEIEIIKKQIGAGFVPENPGTIDRFLKGLAFPGAGG